MTAETAQPPAPKKVADPAPPKKKKPGEDEPELSPEDQELKDKLELCVTRIAEGEPGLASAAVAAIADEVRTATTSMTAVPKPLKFLRSHYASLVDSHAKLAATPAGKDLADVLSVLAITSGEEGKRESLKFRLLGAQVKRNGLEVGGGGGMATRLCAHVD
jgi:26S proteasome regulatory subunit N1